jgi:plasmid maintenance system antidote protein VapI
MTILVISQDAKGVIVNKMVISQIRTMVTQLKSNLSPKSVEAMRPQQIGYRLKLLRNAFDLKPSEIADLLGIERTYWSRFENGKRAITDTVAVALVERFDVTLDFLILGRWEKLPFDLAERLRAKASEKS